MAREVAVESAERPSRARFSAMLERPEEEALELRAYRVGPPPAALVPAPPTRAWIEATPERFARRCLPLMMACQGGWFLLNGQTFRARWDGGGSLDSIKIEHDGPPPHPALSHFGSGILTFHIPYLFRTPPGWNLLARGPSNWPKDAIFPLEGLVETDWSMATFTMNWKFTAPNRPVTFEAGEPSCMITPIRRGDVERFQPRVIELAEDPEVDEGYRAWSESRSQFLTDLADPKSEAVKQKWQKHYFRGISPNGEIAPQHQTKLELRDADDPAGWCPPVDRTIGT
jgi:hypothetical protein